MSRRPQQRKNPAFDAGKTCAPEPGSCVRRERLLNLLDELPRGVPAWIHGPAGAGKTMLAVSYAHARALAVLWYRVDWRDEDPATFFSYFSHAAHAAMGSRADAYPPFGPEYAEGLATYASNLFSHLWKQRAAPLLVVLDNYERLAPSHRLHEILAARVAAAPQGVRWLILSRNPPPPAFASQVVRAIDWGQLRFVTEEANSLLQLAGIQDPVRAARIHDIADGWAAAIVLNAAVGADGEVPRLFGALIDQLLDGAPAQHRELLAKLAVLPDFDQRAAARLGDAAAAGFLATLAAQYPLIERLGDSSGRFRFHPLLRDHLLCRLRGADPADHRALLARAAVHLESEDRFEEAAELHIECADWPRLRDLVCRRQRALCEAHRELTLLRWLEAMPAPYVASDPWLQYWFGLALSVDSARALPRLELAFEGFVAQGNTAGALLCFCAAVQSIWGSVDDFKPLFTWIERRGRVRREMPRCFDPEIRASAAAAHIVATSIVSPGDPSLRHLARLAEYALRLLHVRRLQVLIGGPLVHYYVYSAQNARLFALADRLAPAVDDESAPPLARIHLQGMVSMAYFIRGDAGVIGQLEKCLHIANASGVHQVDNIVRAGIIMCQLNDGALQDAEIRLRELHERSPAHRRFDVEFACYLSAWLAALQGHAQLAVEYAERQNQLSEQIGDVFGTNLGRGLLVQLYAEQGDFQAAGQKLAAMRASIASGTQGVIRHQFLLADTWLKLRSGDLEAALSSLRTLLAFANQQRMMRYHVWRPEVATELCALALVHGIEVEYAERLIRMHKLKSPEPALEAWPWPIRIYTLGRFSVVRDAVPMAFAGKTQRRPLDLLKVLIALGGRGVAQERIAGILWPQADGDAAAASFNMALKRLRELLGQADAVLLSASKLTVNPLVCWVDAWAFERGLKRPGTDLSAGERTLALYRGPFLDSEETSWSLSLRERLRARFLQGARSVGAEFESRRQWARAIDVYRRVLEVDDLAEEFYQLLMICHVQLGQRGEAMSVYRCCSRALSMRLGIAPAQKTVDLYRRLLAS